MSRQFLPVTPEAYSHSLKLQQASSPSSFSMNSLSSLLSPVSSSCSLSPTPSSASPMLSSHETHLPSLPKPQISSLFDSVPSSLISLLLKTSSQSTSSSPSVLSEKPYEEPAASDAPLLQALRSPPNLTPASQPQFTLTSISSNLPFLMSSLFPVSSLPSCSASSSFSPPSSLSILPSDDQKKRISLSHTHTLPYIRSTFPDSVDALSTSPDSALPPSCPLSLLPLQQELPFLSLLFMATSVDDTSSCSDEYRGQLSSLFSSCNMEGNASEPDISSCDDAASHSLSQLTTQLHILYHHYHYRHPYHLYQNT